MFWDKEVRCGFIPLKLFALRESVGGVTHSNSSPFFAQIPVWITSPHSFAMGDGGGEIIKTDKPATDLRLRLFYLCQTPPLATYVSIWDHSVYEKKLHCTAYLLVRTCRCYDKLSSTSSLRRRKSIFFPFRILFPLRKHTKRALYLWAKKENERVGNTNKHTLFVLFFPPRESLLLWLININTPSQDVESELTHSAFPPRYTYEADN